MPVSYTHLDVYKRQKPTRLVPLPQGQILDTLLLEESSKYHCELFQIVHDLWRE